MTRPRPRRQPRPARLLGGRARRGRGLRRLRLRRRRRLTHLGARSSALDESGRDGERREKAELLEVLGADVRLGAGATADAARRRRPRRHLAGLAADRAAARPGPRARHPGLGRGRARLAAARPGRSRRPGSASPAPTARPPPSRCSTRSCARPGCAASRPATSACRSSRPSWTPTPYDVLAVELSSFQLHYTDSMRAESAAVLNVAEDHLDWHGSYGMALRRRQGPDLRAVSSGPASTTPPTP